MVLQHHDTLIEEGGNSLEVPRSFLPAKQKDSVGQFKIYFFSFTSKNFTTKRIISEPCFLILVDNHQNFRISAKISLNNYFKTAWKS
jgi:hypothetical protein